MYSMRIHIDYFRGCHCLPLLCTSSSLITHPHSPHSPTHHTPTYIDLPHTTATPVTGQGNHSTGNFTVTQGFFCRQKIFWLIIMLLLISNFLVFLHLEFLLTLQYYWNVHPIDIYHSVLSFKNLCSVAQLDYQCNQGSPVAILVVQL